MWLLKSRWSNPMKHLIPYLQDDQKAADYLRRCTDPGDPPAVSRDLVLDLSPAHDLHREGYAATRAS